MLDAEREAQELAAEMVAAYQAGTVAPKSDSAPRRHLLCKQVPPPARLSAHGPRIYWGRFILKVDTADNGIDDYLFLSKLRDTAACADQSNLTSLAPKLSNVNAILKERRKAREEKAAAKGGAKGAGRGSQSAQ